MPLRQRARHPRFVRLIWVMATGLGSWIGMTKCCVSGSFAGDAKMQPMYLGGAEIGRSSSWSCFKLVIVYRFYHSKSKWNITILGEYFVLDLFPIIKLSQFPKKMVFWDVGGPSTFWLGGNGPQGGREVTSESMEKYSPEDERHGTLLQITHFQERSGKVIFEPKPSRELSHLPCRYFNQPSEAFRCDFLDLFVSGVWVTSGCTPKVITRSPDLTPS